MVGCPSLFEDSSQVNDGAQGRCLHVFVQGALVLGQSWKTPKALPVLGLSGLGVGLLGVWGIALRAWRWR